MDVMPSRQFSLAPGPGVGICDNPHCIIASAVGEADGDQLASGLFRAEPRLILCWVLWPTRHVGGSW